jgi:hypothetical protein
VKLKIKVNIVKDQKKNKKIKIDIKKQFFALFVLFLRLEKKNKNLVMEYVLKN